MTDVAAEKSRVRASALACRAVVSPDVRLALEHRLADEGLVAIGGDVATKIVSVFLPIRGEPDTSLLLARLAEAGFLTALPLTLGRGIPLRFHLWRPGEPLAPGRWGISEPVAHAPLADPDALFVPLAAFDRRGFRLGYGGGFYDNALARLRAKKPIRAIGVAFSAQEVDIVPREPHDERLDAIITEHETLVFGPG